MAVRITHIRLSGGTTHEHIVRLWWTNPSTGKTGDSTRAVMVSYIENDNGKVYVDDTRGHRANVGVVKPSQGSKYLRTYADGTWTNNLLSLPRK